MHSISAILVTLLSGLFFLVGFLIVKFVKNRKSLAIFSVSMAFVVMIGIIFLDLIPEINELVSNLDFNKAIKIIILMSAIIAGMGILKVLDLFVPHHHHEHHEKEKNTLEHQEHSLHIGLVTSSSLILHNLIEGISIYIISLDSIKAGLLMALAVGLHNIPLGIEIASSFEEAKESKKLKKYMMLLLSFSGVIGAFIFFVLGQNINDLVMLLFMAVSLGMIVYISLFELLQEIFNYKKQKEIYYGMIFGVIILLFIRILE